MRSLRLGVWAVAACMLLCAGRAAAQTDDAEQLKGSWIVANVLRGEGKVEEDRLVIAKISFEYDAAKKELFATSSKNFSGFGPVEKREVKLDGSAKPQRVFDLPKFTLDKEYDGAIGIYELNKTDLKVALTFKKGGKRPEKFEADADVVVYTLVKEDSKAVDTILGDAGDKKRSIKGVWVIDSATLSGRELPKNLIGTIKFTFDGARIKYDLGDTGGSDEATLSLNLQKAPYKIDFENRNKLELGIFELVPDPTDMSGASDILRICVDTSSTRRPTKFESPENSNFMLITLKRDSKPQE